MNKQHINYCILYITLLTLLSSCQYYSSKPKKIYPSHISIPNYGTLLYTKTLFDEANIKDTIIENNIIWSIDYYANILFKYEITTKKTYSYSFRGDQELYNLYWYEIINFKDEIVLFLKIENNEYLKYYIAKFNKKTMQFIYNEMSKDFDNSYLDIYRYQDDIYIYGYKIAENDIYYVAKNNVTDFYPITIEDYQQNKPIEHNDDSIKKLGYTYIHGYTKDSTNISYFIVDRSVKDTNTSLCISVDNEITWFEGKMGTNYANKILIKGAEVYVSSHQYFESIGPFPSGARGGGLHIYTWKTQ